MKSIYESIFFNYSPVTHHTLNIYRNNYNLSYYYIMDYNYFKIYDKEPINITYIGMYKIDEPDNILYIGITESIIYISKEFHYLLFKTYKKNLDNKTMEEYEYKKLINVYKNQKLNGILQIDKYKRNELFKIKFNILSIKETLNIIDIKNI